MGSVPYANVPKIDVSPLYGDDKEVKLNVARQIDEACRGSGFFYASGHGIDVKNLSKVTRDFHMSITEEEKWNLAIRAYNQKNQKQTRNGYSLPIKGKKAVESLCILNPAFTPDHEMIKANKPLHEVNTWPDEEKHPGFKEYQESYFREMCDFSSALLRGFSLALGKEEGFFNQYFKKEDTLSSVVLIRYPYLEDYPAPAIKTAADGTKLSFEWHEDVSLITVLYQSQVQNLQVEIPDQGFVDVEASDDCYLINAGSYMAYITDNYYPAPIHRVKWVNEERQSLPFFVNLGFNDTIEPFNPGSPDSKLDKEAISYGQYLQGGLAGLINKNGQT